MQDLTPQHVANVLICSVRPCPRAEIPFVFEVVSPNKRTYTLQADSELDMKDWCVPPASVLGLTLSVSCDRMEVFHNCTEAMLTKQDVESTDAEKKMSDSEKKKHDSDKNNAYSSLRELNKVCVDCGQQDPDWLSINLGIFICIGACPPESSLAVGSTLPVSAAPQSAPECTAAWACTFPKCGPSRWTRWAPKSST